MAHDRKEIDRRVEVRRPGKHERLGSGGDVEARAAARFDHAFGDQPVIGLDHGGLRHAELLGEAPHRRGA